MAQHKDSRTVRETEAVREVDHSLPTTSCDNCGADLRGKFAGRCDECGERLP